LINIFIIIIAAFIVQFLLRRDLDKGLAAAVFFLVFLPVEVQIPMPGALPQLTAHRVILLIVLAHCWPRIRGLAGTPVAGVLVLAALVAACRLCSTVIALSPSASFKVVLDFLIETVLYFVLILAGLRSRRSIELMAWSSLAALVAVAGIGTIEKYTGINLAAQVVPGMADFPNTVSSTFRHRILFGYAMAMAFPLALALGERADTPWRRRLAGIGFFIVPAACYFSNSRGPWVGFALGTVIIGALGGARLRKKLLWAGVLTAAVLILRPGVKETIVDLWHQTFNDDSVKGESASYRKKLWWVAYSELSKSPERLVFGYGGYSTQMMDLSEYFDRGAGGLATVLGYTSWDSQYASDFMQYGFLGFGLEVAFYLAVLATVLKAWRPAAEADRPFIAACIASTGVFLFAMATVAIFNPQLEFLFWALVAACGRFQYLTAWEPTAGDPLKEASLTDAEGSMAGMLPAGTSFKNEI